MTQTVKVELGDKRGSIWIEAVEVEQEKTGGRTPAGVAGDVVANLANIFEQVRYVFEVAQAQLSLMSQAADETALEIDAKLSTSGKLVIVEGSAEGSIKVTMKWQKPKPKGSSESA
jgi:hypothetical protein